MILSGRAESKRASANRYAVVASAWVFANEQPVVLVYLVDDSGGGYLAADR